MTRWDPELTVLNRSCLPVGALARLRSEPLARLLDETLAGGRQAAGTPAAEFVDGLLADERVDRLLAVRELAADPVFRLALDRGDPALAADLAGWLADPDRTPGERTLRDLVRRLSLAAAQTDPGGVFPTSGPVAWVRYGPPVVAHPGPRRTGDDVAEYHDRRVRLLAGARRSVGSAPGGSGATRISAPTVRTIRDRRPPPPPLATCGTRWWAPVAADLDALRGWLAPFAPTLPARLILTELFGARIRARGPLPVPEFYREYQRIAGDAAELADWSDPTLYRSTRDSVWPSVRQLGQVVDSALAALSPHPAAEHAAGTPASTAGVGGEAAPAVDAPVGTGVCVEVGVLRATTARYPDWVPPLRSLCAGLQITHTPSGYLQAVVNALHPGFGAMRARSDRLAGVRRTIGVPDPSAGGRQVGGRGRWLGVPVSGEPPLVLADTARLPVADLDVHLDDRSGLLALRSRSRRQPVRVVHTGLLTGSRLPPLSRLLAVLSGETPPGSPLGRAPEVAEHPHRWPRLTVGQLVLGRARVSFPADQVPVARPGERDGGYLLRLARWRATHGIPRRCFVALSRRSTGSATRRCGHGGAGSFYLDFDSWLLVQDFVAAVRRPDTVAVVFEEALPDPLGHGVDLADHVTELLLDVAADEPSWSVASGRLPARR
ncbi:lantibiotic dehydratase [Micromonospora radicis]|uniref:Lantibiotic dehydratase N-terminal domain-containing protein n=1 Tax=Micromonospora radicis TaxID=1894971 RepID=A0A418MWJ6_9ACTN|nr:lantibiotic dehydratase [Micromonospora radicis]RIV39110.1 hypothetical protein D2L64_09555 [Micromonospora radicis]